MKTTHTPLNLFAPALCLLLLTAIPTQAQSQETLVNTLVAITLTDGTQVQGTILRQDKTHITIATSSGLEVKVPRDSIVSTRNIKSSNGALTRSDPNYSRLMFAPTGRPLRRGQGYWSNYYIFFPGITYGLTNQISMTAGLSVFPGLGLGDQLLSLAPKIALYQNEDFALSAGTLYMSITDEIGGGMAFLVGTKGSPDKSFTAGLGLGYINEEDEPVDFAAHPVILLGSNIRLSDSLALVSENWFITGENLGLDEQPLGIALRFFGKDLAVDLGAIIIGKVIKEGFPIPWLSAVYHFGD
ncbi:MAG: hypothetical protein OSB73_04680 [Candidatus Latescibacteria bacterium]|nr:hypothetical protein [Candidatus Latescibacterota bacterium]